MRRNPGSLQARLRGLRVMVVEDEYFLADEIVSRLKACGATVLGPAGTLEDGMHLLSDSASVDAAVLDVNLHGDMAFPIAGELRLRGIPFVFATGYDCRTIPNEYRNVPCWEKPLDSTAMALSIRSLIASRQTTGQVKDATAADG